MAQRPRGRPAPQGTAARADRGDETRQKLLTAAIDVFGRHGFEASTRELSAAAGVNLASIPYYFGGKEGLYIAAAEHIAEQISARMVPVVERIQVRLADRATGPDPALARALLGEILDGLIRIMVANESEPWARFIIREQMEPTEAFERIYQGVMVRIIGTARVLVGAIVDRPPDAEETRLHAIALVGQVLIFRAARAAVMRQLDWTSVGEREIAAIRTVVLRSVDALSAPGDGNGTP
jgi:AcrR family transcriptional regulator